jgi:hypothetical protein
MASESELNEKAAMNLGVVLVYDLSPLPNPQRARLLSESGPQPDSHLEIGDLPLKSLAEEWTSRDNKNRDQPFPLGPFAASGRFNRKRLGQLF